MILKGNQRGGARQMALHLMNGDMNEHVSVHEIKGFVSENVMGALNEIYAISRGTQAKQFMYSLSLNPPDQEQVQTAIFEAAIEETEKKLGLSNQPRVIVFHEKEGRRHAHCIWSRIDSEKMTAINLSHDRIKLNTLSKSLYLENGWQMPRGFKKKRFKDPLNFSRAEWQQALRTGRKPQDIKREIQECFAVSDSKQSFEAALKESGFYLARGDRRDVFLVVDLYGENHKLKTKLNLTHKAITARLGDVNKLRTVSEIKDTITKDLKQVFYKQLNMLEVIHKKQIEPLTKEKKRLQDHHKAERNALIHKQGNRQQRENETRQARIDRGFKQFTSKISGRYWRSRKRNEKETWQAHIRDQGERDHLIAQHLDQRQNLQNKITDLQKMQTQERQDLVRDVTHIKHFENDKAFTKDIQQWINERPSHDRDGHER